MANDYPQYQAVPLTTLFTYSLKVSQSARLMSGQLSADQRWLFVGLNFERVDDCRFCEPKSFPSGWSDGASTRIQPKNEKNHRVNMIVVFSLTDASPFRSPITDLGHCP